MSNVPAGEIWGGYPAQPMAEAMQGDAVTGTYEAHYAKGSVLKGTFSGTRKTK